MNEDPSDHRTPWVPNPTFFIPEADCKKFTVCQISFIYPPLKPKGRMSGSRSKLELTFCIVIFFEFSGFKDSACGKNPERLVAPASTDDFINFLREIILSSKN